MEMSAKRFAEMAESDLFMREKGLYLFGIVLMSIFLKKTRKTNSNWFRGCKKNEAKCLVKLLYFLCYFIRLASLSIQACANKH